MCIYIVHCSFNFFICIFICLFFQNDLLQLVQPFGAVTKTVMLRAKNQVTILGSDLFVFVFLEHFSVSMHIGVYDCQWNSVIFIS
jgi:hypothetical protein